jgi:hypothetical protein
VGGVNETSLRLLTMLKDRLEKALGARVMSLASMPVGFGLQGLKVDLADGRRLAVKLREGSAHADLSLEAYMLGELARHSDLPVPAVHLSEPDLLAMDFIETDGGGITARVERHAAELNRSMSSIGKMSEHPSRGCGGCRCGACGGCVGIWWGGCWGWGFRWG